MRRALALIWIGGLLLLAGCGSSSPSSSNGARDAELSYFPSDSPFVGVLPTDPNGRPSQDAKAFLSKFPLSGLALAALQSRAARSGVDWSRDLRPLMGNPVAIGVPGTHSGGLFLVAFVTKDAGKLAALTQRSRALQSAGSYDGARLYQAKPFVLAIDGATALVALSLDGVKAALDRHAHGGGINPTDYGRATSGLPQDTLLQVYGNVAGALSRTRVANARTVPWVAAIRSYAAAITINPSGVNLSFRIETTAGALRADQLPLASGSTSPNVAGQAPVAVGVHDVAQTIAFAQAAAQATDPVGYARLLARGGKYGVDLQRDVFSQFTGDLSVEYGPGGVLARADLRDPAAAPATLAKLSGAQLFAKTTKVTRTPDGFYSVKAGSKTVYFGVVGSRFVAGTATPSQLRAFAAAPATPIAGAQGAVALRLRLDSLVSLALQGVNGHGKVPQAVESILAMFGDVTGWAADDPSGLHGSLSAPLK
jgi:hypothetical protein